MKSSKNIRTEASRSSQRGLRSEQKKYRGDLMTFLEKPYFAEAGSWKMASRPIVFSKKYQNTKRLGVTEAFSIKSVMLYWADEASLEPN